MVICTEYGVQLSEEGEKGACHCVWPAWKGDQNIYTLWKMVLYFQVSKSDLISHIKKNNLARHFEAVKFESDKKQKNVAITAFR